VEDDIADLAALVHWGVTRPHRSQSLTDWEADDA
jgi:hypothetical protein